MNKKILIIDQLLDTSLLAELGKLYQVEIVDSLSAFQTLLEDDLLALSSFDVVFIDPQMDPEPMFSAFESLQGQKTGCLLFEQYLKDAVECPVVVWSMLSYIIDLNEECFSDKNLEFRRKARTIQEIVDIIDLL